MKFILFLLASIAFAQTTPTGPTTQQLFCKAVPGHPVVAVAVPPASGGTVGVKTGMTCIPLDLSAFIIDNSTNPPTLRINFPPSGGSTTVFVDDEVPAGAVDGLNTTFTCASATPQGLEVFRNGIRENVGVDYLVSGGTVTFLAVAIPQTGDLLKVKYRK